MPQIKSVEDITFGTLLGRGGFGTAHLCTTKSGKKMVVKTINKATCNQRLIMREIVAGESISHKNVVKFYSSFEDQKNEYLMFEYVQGKNLFQHFHDQQYTAINEHESRIIFKQLAKAVASIHKKGIAHLDIKLENIMYDSATQKVKLIDFGLCNFLTKENGGNFNYRVGSEEYWAPEMVTEKIAPYSGTKVDVWCLGMVLYCLLNGTFPFNAKSRRAYVRSTGFHPKFKFTEPISILAQDLIQKMLEVNPEKRISMEEVLNHKWIKKGNSFFNFWN